MVSMKLSKLAAVALFLNIQFIAEIQCTGLIGGVLHTVGSLLANDVVPLLQSSTTRAFARLKTVNMCKT